MAGKRLIPAARVADWEDRLRAAVDKALDEALSPARQALAKADRAVTAASDPKRAATAALTGLALLSLWDQAQWQRLLGVYLEPEIEAIEAEATGLATDAVPAFAAFGFASSGAMAQAIMATAVGAGAALGARLADAGQGGDPSKLVTDVLATAGAIVGGLVARMAEALSNSVTTELGQYITTTTDPGTPGTRTWNAMDDDRTRESHASADGQEVGLDEAFTVGSDELMFPGDPSGSDEETMNCRCWLTVTGLSDAQDQQIENDAASQSAA